MNVIKISPTNSIGTSFRGRITAIPREEIVAILGEPNRTESGDGKITCQWVLSVGGTVVTLYDYKGDKWHFGGFNNTRTLAAIQVVADMLNQKVR